jgi:predicted methyltransferase
VVNSVQREIVNVLRGASQHTLSFEEIVDLSQQNMLAVDDALNAMRRDGDVIEIRPGRWMLLE